MPQLKQSSPIRTLAGIAAALILVACGGNGSGSTSGGTQTGSLTLGITDTPVDSADEVWVQFTGVEIVPADESDDGAGNGSADTGEPAAGSETITFAEPKQINLLLLQGGLRETLLEDHELPAEQYGQIRLLVQTDQTEDTYIVINGAIHELDIPSGSQTGLKLVHNFNIGADANTDFTIDFNLRKSVVLANGEYKLKPVLRLVETESAATLSGTIDPNIFQLAGHTCSEAAPEDGAYGVYVYAGAGATPGDLGSEADTAVDEAEPVASTGVSRDENNNYAYAVGFLEPGEYTIAATCQADQDTDAVADEIAFTGVVDITVQEGSPVTHNFE